MTNRERVMQKALMLRCQVWEPGLRVDDLLDRVMAHLNLSTARVALPCGARAVIYDRLILLDTGLSPAERRWAIAHEIGHYVLHAGDFLTFYEPVLGSRRERQADLFAGTLLLGWPVADPPETLADEYGLPFPQVAAWLRSAGTLLEVG